MRGKYPPPSSASPPRPITLTYLPQYSTSYKLALKTGFYEFQAARDTYREATTTIRPHKDLISRFVEVQALLITPFAPHWADYIYREVLQKPTSIQNALFPTPSVPVSTELTAALSYVHATTSNIASTEAAQAKRKAKGKYVAYDASKPKRLTIFVALAYPAWQEKYIDLIRETFDMLALRTDDKALNARIAGMGEMKKAMPFVQGIKRRLQVEPYETVFDRKLVFDEVAVLKEVVAGIGKMTGAVEIRVVTIEENGKGKRVDGGREEEVDVPAMAESAEPGNPKFEFENV